MCEGKIINWRKGKGTHHYKMDPIEWTLKKVPSIGSV